MLARCDRGTGDKAPNMDTDHQAGLLTCEIDERPVLRAYLPVHPGGLAGAWWHRFGLGGLRAGGSMAVRAEKGGLMSDEVLRLRGVEVRRDAAVLLRNVDWTAHGDERWILIGPNGAGKTTLLQVASTMMFATEGTVDVLGERLGEVDIFDLRPRIGLTSAAVAEQVPPGEKVIDLVLTASYAILGRWKEEYDSADVTRAVEMLDALGCAHLIRRKFSTLSEGERKRVQIARALMPDPELLLLDEPAAGLDLGGREDLLRRLTKLARDPKAPMMVLVTHHVEEVPDGFTHAMLLRRGSVLAAGPIEEVFTARNLSRCFGVQLEIEHRQSRWTARAR
jgi:iron complex transport system ATP-binding protein